MSPSASTKKSWISPSQEEIETIDHAIDLIQFSLGRRLPSGSS